MEKLIEKLIKFLNEKKMFFNYSFYKNNSAYFITIGLIILIHVFLIILQANLYSNSNAYVIVAKVAGILIDFNSCLIILLVLRRLTTFLRNSYYGRKLIAFDEFINIHKIIGSLIVILGFVHTLFHCINFYYKSSNYYLNQQNNNINNNSNSTTIQHYYTFAELLFTTKSNIGWFNQTVITGWIILIILIIIQIFSLPIIRNNGHFELFYYTHWLHILYYIIMIIHSEDFWKWFIIPFVFVLIERLYSIYKLKSKKYGLTLIKQVNLLASNVTNLVITKPKNFKFKSGDYIFINIPSITRAEWHPFTISSAPEQSDHLTLHIRSLGNWTNNLYAFFYRYSRMDPLKHTNRMSPIERRFKITNSIIFTDYKRLFSQKVKKIEISTIKEPSLNLPVNRIENLNMQILIDGPYGTASRDIFNSEHAVLIAAGIGVTPFASILQSLWFKFLKSYKECSTCKNCWFEDIDEKNLKKVDFIWINRDYDSFEWFIELLGKLEAQQLNSKFVNNRFIQIHLYMTSAKIQQEIKLKDNINGESNDFSLRLNPGRPNLDEIFLNVSNETKGKVDVYYCGNVQLGEMIETKCVQYKYKFAKEYF
jgi:NADPH oxidase 5